MKVKILFIIPSLKGGGSERVISTLLKHFNRDHFVLHLGLNSSQGTYVSELPPDIVIHHFDVLRVRSVWLPIIKLVWKIKPHVILSTLGHLNILLLSIKWLMPKRTKIIVRESNTVSEEIKHRGSPKMWQFLYRFLYKKANKIICQSNVMKQDLIDNFHIPSDKTAQIYNPVDVELIEKRSKESQSPFVTAENGVNIVAIGRLAEQKGLFSLIKSFSLFVKRKPDAKLWILGEGELEMELKSLVSNLQLSPSIHFVGFQQNPYVWLKHADLFVLSSKYEGLPNVLLEAIACECPVLVSEHPGGTKEIMMMTHQDHRYVQKVKFDRIFFERDMAVGKELIIENFAVEKIVAQYESIIDSFS
ncbi:glycosyltransferase [Pseudogracilibacillus auburnensis]|uniref:Glycosyltransferase involved in cell wall biosynthesis n=1 Tax=Pseudogracilibacillus auburnensis TaxID=1494959 RepID=A0A2V3VF96_9BACI|nr:glycosyltransferase [Pseudogracilibacillus auburnensis]MBO1005301.1 glycosyltransferase [Pseudogracilibacillus auburnensis]PXW80496.1 glycosyltransferase involved in cell wall biosynthesis [Pseudogracilibacillus auburnensis]